MQLIITIECKPENVRRIQRVASLLNSPAEWDGDFPIESMQFATAGTLDEVTNPATHSAETRAQK